MIFILILVIVANYTMFGPRGIEKVSKIRSITKNQ